MINDNLLSVTGGDLISYLNGSEGTATSVNQAWMDYLTREGYTTGTLNDRLYNKLRDDGFTGTLADMLTGFWNTPPVNYVARLNGTDQYWQLSEPIILPSSANFRVEVDASINYGLSSSWAGIMFGDFSGDLLRFYASKSDGLPSDLKLRIGARRNTGILWVDGALSSLSFYRKSDMVTVSQGNEDYSFVEVGGFSIEVIGSIGGSSDFLDGYVRNLRIYDANDNIINEIPLTNKAQGATQLATVGSVNATMVGYTPDVWEVLPELWYNKTTGMVICSDSLIQCNDEVIPCL